MCRITGNQGTWQKNSRFVSPVTESDIVSKIAGAIPLTTSGQHEFGGNGETTEVCLMKKFPLHSHLTVLTTKL